MVLIYGIYMTKPTNQQRFVSLYIIYLHESIEAVYHHHISAYEDERVIEAHQEGIEGQDKDKDHGEER